jgi:hypothetical protein
MEIGSGPGSLPDLELESREGLLERLPFEPFTAGLRVFGSESFQVLAHKARQSGVSLDRDLAHFFDDIIVE